MKKIFSFIFIFSCVFFVPQADARLSDERRLNTSVKIYIMDSQTGNVRSTGSGVVIAGDKILTAFHVVSAVARDNNRFEARVCVTKTDTDEPICAFSSKTVIKKSEKFDLALLSLDAGYDSDNSNFIPWASYIKKYDTRQYLDSVDLIAQYSNEKTRLGDDIIVLGYPAVGGKTITLTTGAVSGFKKEIIGGKEQIAYIKTDAKLNPGNSGGGVFNAENQLIGIAISVFRDVNDIGNTVGMIAIKDFLYGAEEQIYGEICYDYVNAEKSDGKCECRAEYEWNDEHLLCLKPGQTKTLDIQKKKEEKEATKEAEEVDQVDLEKTDEDKSIVPDSQRGSEEITESILKKRLKTVIIESISLCKKESVWGNRSALKQCLKMNIITFIKERNAEKRRIIKICKKENSTISREEIRACIAEKAEKGEGEKEAFRAHEVPEDFLEQSKRNMDEQGRENVS